MPLSNLWSKPVRLAASTMLVCSLVVGCSSPNPSPPSIASKKAQIKFMRSDRLRVVFARVLQLDEETLCKELGLFSCLEKIKFDFVEGGTLSVSAVHGVSLGGVDAYSLGIFEGAVFTGVTSPMSIDRIALHGCIQRADKDLDPQTDPSEVVFFGSLEIDGAGQLEDVEAQSVQSTIEKLYQTVLLRNPTEDESKELKALYTDIAATEPAQPAREWAVLTCMITLTTIENLFY